MNVGVIGCGNIGLKRVQAMKDDVGTQIRALVEVNPERSSLLKDKFGFLLRSEYREVLANNHIDAVVVSTPPNAAYQIILDCLQAGKHVLCEKPLGRSVEEAQAITKLAEAKRLVLKCGFNLRHDAGLIAAASLLKEGKIGSPYFFKCSYVNGTVGVNANRVGSLLDMGTHIIDLAYWFIGGIKTVQAKLSRFEYDIESLDDNGFAILSSDTVTCMMHFSLVRWSNSFSLEVTGEKGTISVENLPKWGTQHVTFQRRVFPAGIPETSSTSFEGDLSWANEWREFHRCVTNQDMRWNTDGLRAMEVAALLRRSSEEGQTLTIKYEQP